MFKDLGKQAESAENVFGRTVSEDLSPDFFIQVFHTTGFYLYHYYRHSYFF